MMFTQEERRDKIRSQLFYELRLPETPKDSKDKLKGGLSKRAKFLSKSENLKSKNELSNEMPPMKKKL